MNVGIDIGAYIKGFKNNIKPTAGLKITILNENGDKLGLLSCVDFSMCSNTEIISDLTTWRKRFMRYFMTQFGATDERTIAWLKRVVLPAPDKLLFIITTFDGKRIGNFGIRDMSNSTGELDNLIRGRKGGDPRLVYYSELTLLTWLFDVWGYEKVFLHVFSNNRPTIRLHESVGFSVTQSHKLSILKTEDGLRHCINETKGHPVDYDCLRMEISSDKFHHANPWVADVFCDRLSKPFEEQCAMP